MITKKFHDKHIYSRRMERLKELLLPLLQKNQTILDLGCGDGKIDSLLLKEKDVSIKGIDVLVRPQTYIEVKEYDGKHIPFPDNSFDTVMAIDVLHHTDVPADVFAEMVRTSKKYIVIKDHIRTGLLSYLKLRAMDYVGNAHYHVRLPYHYLKESEWLSMFEANNLNICSVHTNLHLYTGIFHVLFDRKLHVLYKLEKPTK